MRDGVNVFPELLAQATELEDRVELGLARRLFQEMSDLLSEGAVLALSALLKLLVKIVREVLDVERRHDSGPPYRLHFGGWRHPSQHSLQHNPALISGLRILAEEGAVHVISLRRANQRERSRYATQT